MLSETAERCAPTVSLRFHCFCAARFGRLKVEPTMKFLPAFSAILFATPAFAHLGHVGELAGHAHWIGLGAAAVAAALGSAAALAGKKRKETVAADEEAERGQEKTVEEPAS